MATVAELSAPYENHLVPVLPAGDGVCETCHTSVVGGWFECYPCYEAKRALTARADAVDFVALAVKFEQLAHELRFYKGLTQSAAREATQYGLAAVLWRWLSVHEDCVRNAAGVDEFPIVTTVPSTSGRTSHPLRKLVHTLIGATRDRARDLLNVNPDVDTGRDAYDHRFLIAGGGLSGQAVLVIDDTWTTGGRAQSAASALKAAGAGAVGIVAIGRHFNRLPAGQEYADAAEAYYKRARDRGWDWSKCCLCDDR